MKCITASFIQLGSNSYLEDTNNFIPQSLWPHPESRIIQGFQQHNHRQHTGQRELINLGASRGNRSERGLQLRGRLQRRKQKTAGRIWEHEPRPQDSNYCQNIFLQEKIFGFQLYELMKMQIPKNWMLIVQSQNGQICRYQEKERTIWFMHTVNRHFLKPTWIHLPSLSNSDGHTSTGI